MGIFCPAQHPRPGGFRLCHSCAVGEQARWGTPRNHELQCARDDLKGYRCHADAVAVHVHGERAVRADLHPPGPVEVYTGIVEVFLEDKPDKVEQGLDGVQPLETKDIQETVIKRRVRGDGEVDPVELNVAGNQHQHAPADPVTVNSHNGRGSGEITQHQESGYEEPGCAQPSLAFRILIDCQVKGGVEPDATPTQEMPRHRTSAGTLRGRCTASSGTTGRETGPAYIHLANLAFEQEAGSLQECVWLKPARHGEIQLAGQDVAGPAWQHAERRIGANEAVDYLGNCPVTARHEYRIAAFADRAACVGGGISRPAGLLQSDDLPPMLLQKSGGLADFFIEGPLSGDRVVGDQCFHCGLLCS
jgi:hypothetical protein